MITHILCDIFVAYSLFYHTINNLTMWPGSYLKHDLLGPPIHTRDLGNFSTNYLYIVDG